MKTVIVIQARLGSSRLPCKTLLNLHGLPVIDWVVGRWRALGAGRRSGRRPARYPARRSACPPLAGAGRQHLPGASEQDVLSRMHGAAAAHGAALVVRVCCRQSADLGRGNRQPDPLLPARTHRRKLRLRLQPHPAQQPLPRRPRRGNRLLRTVHQGRTRPPLPAHREHCLSYIVDNPELFASRPSTRSIRPCTIRK